MNLNNNQKIMSLINSPKFAYFYGYFVADGSYYKDLRGNRFEFSDGTSVKEELKYSFGFMNNIKTIIEDILQKNLFTIRKRENKYILNFRSKYLDKVFRNYFYIKPGAKSFSIKIPNFYINTSLEKYFWLGVMDGDGMVARKSRKISLETGSVKLIEAFKNFLYRNNITFKESGRTMRQNKFYRITIKTNFFRNYCSKLGFLHPRKRLWLSEHLKTNDFYKNNIIKTEDYILTNNIIDYGKIFNSSRIMIVNGKELLKEYGLKHRGRKNRKFIEILQKFNSKNISKTELFKSLFSYRWKMSKGSTTSIKVPLYFNQDVLDVARFIRLRDGSVTLSRNYIKSFNLNPDKIIRMFEQLFDIKPKYTCRGEPIFCSGVLKIFFSKIINNPDRKLVVLPKWHQNLK